MGAAYFLVETAVCPVYGIFDYADYLRIAVCGITFVSRLEIEYFSVTPSVTAAGSQNLSDLKAAYENKLIRLGYAERLSIGLLMLKPYKSVHTLRYRVRRIDCPQVFTVSVLSPRKGTGRTHKKLKWL